MEKVRFGIVGLGNQGTLYTKILEQQQKVENGVLAAVCDVKPERIAAIKELLGEAADKIAYFDDAETMFKSGLIDIAMIETPHYDHPSLAIKALEAGIHCCVDKPAGVYTKQVREMLAAAEKSDKILGIMFNQRSNPLFRKMRDMIAGGEIGEIKRTNWIITDWYRTQIYYDSGDWRGTWAGEGGGVLYNQAPHQLDLLQWIVG
ncbi:MAG: Gfo/Idh/MocA family oxidoreductase, partial [Clostridia bacterium]|nr:Gfo/Idh/MocA family oxidoreductase [Clostridia bacterium]